MSDQPINPVTTTAAEAQASAAASPDIAAGLAASTDAATQKGPGPAAIPFHWGTGRRKTAVARVRIRTGTGKFLIRQREINDYFYDTRQRSDVTAPLRTTSTFGKFDVFVNVRGGGQTGQCDAIVLGLARALVKADQNLEGALRDAKYLTRDSRKVERKKPGRPGARKRFQFSKR